MQTKQPEVNTGQNDVHPWCIHIGGSAVIFTAGQAAHVLKLHTCPCQQARDSETEGTINAAHDNGTAHEVVDTSLHTKEEGRDVVNTSLHTGGRERCCEHYPTHTGERERCCEHYPTHTGGRERCCEHYLHTKGEM